MHIIAYTLTNSLPLHLPAFICIYVAVSSDNVSVYVLTNVEAMFYTVPDRFLLRFKSCSGTV